MRKRVLWIVIVLAILAAPVLWYLGSPLLINKTVNEPFPAPTSVPQPALPKR